MKTHMLVDEHRALDFRVDSNNPGSIESNGDELLKRNDLKLTCKTRRFQSAFTGSSWISIDYILWRREVKLLLY
jgi:hypothetical protein